MPANYNGNGTLPSPTSGGAVAGTGTGYVRKAISAVANTTPIAVTCTGHGFNSGDTIEQENTGVCDGLWVITVTGTNTYTLNGSTAAGTGSTGYAIDYELQPAFYIEQPGNAASMVTLAPVLEGLANTIPFLYRRAGKFRVYNQYSPAVAFGYVLTGMTGNPWSTTTGLSTSSTPVALTSATATLEALSDTTSIPPLLANGDWIETEINFTAMVNNSGGAELNNIQIGVAFVQGGTVCGTLFMPSVLIPSTSTVLTPFPVSLHGYNKLVNGVSGCAWPSAATSICIFARVDYNSGGGTCQVQLIGPCTGYLRQWRAN